MKTAIRSFLHTAMRLAAILLSGIIIGFALLVAAYSLPLEAISAHVRLSAQAFDGSWATGETQYEQLVKGYLTTQLDNTTDASMLLAAAHESEAPVVQQVLDTATYYYGSGTYAALLEYGQHGTSTLSSSSETRYWHGFLVYLKPLLCFFSYMDIRMLQVLFQTLLLGGVLAGFGKRGIARFSMPFMIALLALTPAVIGFSLQFSTVYTVMLLSMLVLLHWPKLAQSRDAAGTLFLVTGMATSYIDYLTYPIASFGVPFVVLLLLAPATSRKKAMQRFTLCLACWLIGYFGMWAGKWVLALLFGHDPWFAANLIAKISQRSAYASHGTSFSLLSVLGEVFKVFAKKAYLMIAAAVAAGYAWLLTRAVLRRGGFHSLPKRSLISLQLWPRGQGLALLCTAALPFVWFTLASNHTHDHAFFTSRALVVTVFALCALLTYPLGGEVTANAGTQEAE